MALHHNPRIVTSGLVLALDAGDVNSYPGSGTTWYDMSGNGYSGTLVNGVTKSSDVNGSLYFDGTDDHIVLSSNTNTRLANTQQTISIFVYVRSVGSNSYAELYSVSGNGYHLVKWLTNGVAIGISSYFYDNVISVSNAYNQWMDITCVIDWNTDVWKLYKNGAYVGASSITPTSYVYTNPTIVAVGDNNATGNPGDFLKGSIGTIKIYNRELSALEIQQNYLAQKSRFGL